MDQKNQLKLLVSELVKTNKNISSLQEEIRNQRKTKNLINEKLIQFCQANEIDGFDINNGQLIYTKTKIKKAIGKKMLQDTLRAYFDNDEAADKVSSHILDSRQETIKESIKIKMDKIDK